MPAGAEVVELAAWRACTRRPPRDDGADQGALAVERLRDHEGNVVLRRRLSLDAARADPALKDLLDIWSTGCRKRPPAFGDFDPGQAAGAGLLDQLSIVAVTDPDPAEYRYTYSGTGITARFDFDITGLRLIDLPGPALIRTLAEDYVAIRASGLPRFQEIAFLLEGRARGYRRLILPYAGDGREVERLLIAITPAQFASP